MAQPPHIPQEHEKKKTISLKYQKSESFYSSPNYVPKGWRSTRPGDVTNKGNPNVSGFGNQGPDQGYLLKLLEGFLDELYLFDGEHEKDVLDGCSWLALKRASAAGRAPIAEDIEVSLKAFGYSYENPPVNLVEFRKGIFQGISHEAIEFRTEIAELIPEDILLLKPVEIAELQRTDWKLVFNLK